MRPSSTVADHLAQQRARRRVAELEVAQRDHARGAGFGLEVGRFVGVERERLVAQHGLAAGQREPHVRGVQERRGVHADQIDVGARRRGAYCSFVSGRYHVDDLAAVGLGEHRCHHPPAEPGADDDHPHLRADLTRATPTSPRRGTASRSAAGAGSTPGTRS